MDLLARLADPGDRVIPAERVLVVVAHPDDETIGVGGQLARLRGVTIVHATDGAPRRGRYHEETILPPRGRWPERPEGVTEGTSERSADPAGTNVAPNPAPAVTPPHPPMRGGIAAREREPSLPPIPFPSPAAYAAARRAELVEAAALAGVTPDRLIGLDIPDQETAFQLAALAWRLADLFAAHRTETVVTHAYEGGHPDHDALAFAVAAAVRLNRAAGLPAPEVIEMPLYRASPQGWILQAFEPVADHPEVRLALDPDALARKRAMIAAHASQADVLAHFTGTTEPFRHAPRHDFTVSPNGGLVHYDRWGIAVTGALFADLAAQARVELGFDRREG